MNVKFFKYKGTGNDFIIIDLRKFNININKETVRKILIENMVLDLMD